MLRRYIIGISLSLFWLSACKTTKPVETAEEYGDEDGIVMVINGVEVHADEYNSDEEVNYQEYAEAPVYLGSAKRVMDLQHTSVKIYFDWLNQTAEGKATLLLKPYAKPVDYFYIDAVAMQIHSLEVRQGFDKKPCSYSYDGSKILVRLSQTLQAGENIELIIQYTAQPELVMNEASNAITDAKGLYFINPTGTEKNKARQIWTQGETQSTSAWLPTIDAPNEKMTHDIFITVHDTLQTIANGEFMSSSQEDNNMRTDHWKMEKPHAPYLVALVVGQFYTEKAEWNDVPLTYYVDPIYQNSCHTIFGNTPEMIDFFSKKLNYPYPWAKYDQVVVDDFVSGAMENTTITIHGDMLKLDTRELLDDDYEDVIAHELFHHWFGDLVTCEAWGQLPLNESFATYGEYLWREHQYGREFADEHLYSWLQQYFMEASSKQVPMIRSDYSFQEEMFDAHSYQKGGLILHMLRSYLGDDIFFKGLSIYLKKFEFGTAEIHNLRQAFEEASGEDLNWFFNQWFFQKGHPILEVTHTYEKEGSFYTLKVEQIQDLSELGAYRLPVWIEFHFGDSVFRELLDIKTSSETYFWEFSQEPDWVCFDAKSSLLAKVREIKTDAQWLATLKHSPLFKERQNALFYLNEEGEDMEIIREACSRGLADKNYRIKIEAMDLVRLLAPDEISGFGTIIIDLAENHPKSATRAAAFGLLKFNPVSGLQNTIKKGLHDSSYTVNAAALELLYSIDPEKGVEQAKQWVGLEQDMLRYEALNILSQDKGDYNAYFQKAWEMEDGNKFYMVALLSQYIKKQDDPKLILPMLNLINSFEPVDQSDYFVVLFITQINQQLQSKWERKLEEAQEEYKKEESPENLKTLQQIQILLDNILKL